MFPTTEDFVLFPLFFHGFTFARDCPPSFRARTTTGLKVVKKRPPSDGRLRSARVAALLEALGFTGVPLGAPPSATALTSFAN